MATGLKTTYRAPAQPSSLPELPAPWTQHKAPSGHTYYFNPETKQSTYSHPAKLEAQTSQLSLQNLPQPARFPSHVAPPFIPTQSHQYSHRDHQHRPGQPQDRPKSKVDIPGCSPWILVNTRLGRRFVHNPDTNESFWKIPEHLTHAVVELDISAARKRAAESQAKEEPLVEPEPPVVADASEVTPTGDEKDQEQLDGPPAESDEYEEVEVTDDDGDELDNEQGRDNDYGDQSPAKRQRLSKEQEEAPAPAEMGEDDMAWQLAQMGESYDLDPGEYGDEGFEEDWDEGAQGLPLSAEEAESSFKNLLDDYRINPYTTWDAVVADGAIIDDDRYTLLPTMKARRKVFAAWSSSKIQALKQEKDRQTKQNPRISYLAFLEKHASPKLFWPEFKRKFKKEPELKSLSLNDKEREKLYREHINRLTKVSEPERANDLSALLNSIPVSESWNRSTSLDDLLPTELLTDVKFISLPGPSRDSIIRAHLERLPAPDQVSSANHASVDPQVQSQREKAEEAVRRRELDVQDARRQQEKELRHGQRMLRNENRELERAMKVDKTALGKALDD